MSNPGKPSRFMEAAVEINRLWLHAMELTCILPPGCPSDEQVAEIIKARMAPSRSFTPPDPRHLQTAASHVAYEFAMFRMAVDSEEFFQGNHPGNLVREAFLVHLRNLLTFFHCKRRLSSDVVVGDYLEQDTTWKPIAPAWLETVLERCNKLLAHITYDRVDYVEDGKMSWEVADPFSHIIATWAAFIRALPEERRRWFASSDR